MSGSGPKSGYFFLYASAILFALTSVFVKLASAYIPGTFISTIRFLVGITLAVPAALFIYRSIIPQRPWLIVFRGLFGSLSMILSYLAIAYTAPGRATMLSNTYPVWVAVMGSLFFGERPGWKTAASLCLCTAGAYIVMQDGSGTAMAGDLIALASAVFAGIAINFVRKASPYANPFTMYLSPCLFGLPIGLVMGKIPAIIPSTGILLALSGGVLAFLAQVLMARGYRAVPAGKGAVVFYFETFLTLVLGIAFFGERPNLIFGMGLALIVAGLILNSIKSASAVNADTLPPA